MSERNGDRARFQKNRKRKLLRRERARALVRGGRSTPDAARATAGPGVPATRTASPTLAASLVMPDEGGPLRSGD